MLIFQDKYTAQIYYGKKLVTFLYRAHLFQKLKSERFLKCHARWPVEPSRRQTTNTGEGVHCAQKRWVFVKLGVKKHQPSLMTD